MQDTLKLKPSLRGYPVTFILCETIGVAFLASGIAGRVWRNPGNVAPWAILVLAFAGGPITFRIFGGIAIDSLAVKARNAFGYQKSCPRRAVGSVNLAYSTVMLRAHDGRLLLKLSRVWTDEQLETLGQFLGVPLEGYRRGERWRRPPRRG